MFEKWTVAALEAREVGEPARDTEPVQTHEAVQKKQRSFRRIHTDIQREASMGKTQTDAYRYPKPS